MQPMSNNKRPGWFIYPAWVVLSTISIPLAWVIAWVLISQTKKIVGATIQVGGTTRITEDYLLTYFFLPALGLLMGFLQYLLLRRHLQRMGWWVAVTTLGLLLTLLSGKFLFSPFYAAFGSAIWLRILTTALMGGALGLVQWLVLRQRVNHAAWWILANLLGWAIVGWGAATLSNQMVLFAVGTLLVPGTVTSLTLWLLLDRLPQHDDSRKNPLLNKSLETTR